MHSVVAYAGCFLRVCDYFVLLLSIHVYNGETIPFQTVELITLSVHSACVSGPNTGLKDVRKTLRGSLPSLVVSELFLHLLVLA